MFRKIKRFIRNVRLWYPILIEDEQWDYQYLYTVMEHKLKLMEDMFRGDNTYTEDILIYADEIKECRELLGRLIEDDYMTEEAKKYYGNMNISDINKPISDKDKSNIEIWSKEEYLSMKRDKDRLFGLLNDNIGKWWD